MAKSPRNSKIDHAVVWHDGIIHDPHPSNAGLAEVPDTFTLFLPLDPILFKFKGKQSLQAKVKGNKTWNLLIS
jgi:hypothetical protein